MVVGAVTSPEVIVHLTAADVHVDYDAALLIVQSSKARQYGALVSKTKLFIKDVLLRIASGRCVCVCMLVVGVCVYVLVVRVCVCMLVVSVCVRVC